MTLLLRIVLVLRHKSPSPSPARQGRGTCRLAGKHAAIARLPRTLTQPWSQALAAGFAQQTPSCHIPLESFASYWV